jgi:rhodanese-related sulfurtransferase/membrane protein DedA with SNARE-associated domain
LPAALCSAPLWGTVCNVCGAGVGAILAFLIARYLASDWVAAKAGGRLKQVVAGVETEGWRFVAFVRLVPIFPFNLINYALGLTRLSLAEYVPATLICMTPGTIAYAYLGYAGREALVHREGMVEKGLVALGLLAIALFLPRLVRRLRSRAFAWIDAPQLRKRMVSGDAPLVVDVRDPDEFERDLGHLESAKNIPVREISQRIAELGPYKTRPIVLVCRTQMRSATAATTLWQAGFSNLAVLRGGMVEWHRRQLPVDDIAAQQQRTA